MIHEQGRGLDNVNVGAGLMVEDKIRYKAKWTIRKYQDDEAYRQNNPYEINQIDGNLLLNEGINELLLLLIGGSATAFNNATARIGVGDDTTVESAAQTDLQAASNKLYKAMETSYPSVSGQTVTFRSVFGSAEANYNWREFTVANGTSGSAKNLNRKVSTQGTKASGQTWTVDLAITIG